MQLSFPLDGWCHGPLFKVVKRRPARKDLFKTGWMRRKSEEQATVPWADKKAINKIFAERRRLTRETGIRHAVDHIVPLKHPAVCGLHIHFNLQVIPYEDNAKKSNNWWPDMWGVQGELL